MLTVLHWGNSWRTAIYLKPSSEDAKNGRASPHSNSPSVTYFFHQHLLHFRTAFQLHNKGAIDDDVYKSIENGHIRFMANPGNRVWWKMVGESLVEEKLAQLINAQLAKVADIGKATTEAWAFFDPVNWGNQDDA